MLASSLGTARADRYELTLTLKPIGTLVRVGEDIGPGGERTTATAYGAGGAISLGYGVRNWLDISAEVAAVQLATAEYAGAEVLVGGSPRTGLVTRGTRSGQLRLGATLRLGVSWVPSVYLGVGIGGRMRGAATFVLHEDGRTLDLVPDGLDAEIGADLVPLVRLGLEHRLTPRWTLGVSAGASYWIGLGAPSAQAVEVGLLSSYSWYP